MPNELNQKEIVERLLQRDKRCRHDTKWLTYRVFQLIAKKYGQRIFIPFNLFSRFPSFESIAKCKRVIMNKEGKFKEEFVAEEGVTYEQPSEIQHG